MFLTSSLEIIPLNSNIILTSSIPKKWFSPKLSFTSNRVNKSQKHDFSAPCGPCLFQWNRCLVTCIMLVHRVYVLVVILQRLWVLVGYHVPTNRPIYFFAHQFIFSICGHQNHDIIFLFHIKYMKSHIVNSRHEVHPCPQHPCWWSETWSLQHQYLLFSNAYSWWGVSV